MSTKVTRYSQLAPKKRLFIDYYLKTDNIIDSYFAAGYKDGCNQNDKEERARAYRAARNILAEPVVKDYVMANKPIEMPKNGEIDIAQITDRMLLIMEGNIEQQQVIKGKIVYVKPSYRDMIEAGKLLKDILKDREKKTEKRASKALTSKVASLIGSARTDVVDEQESTS